MGSGSDQTASNSTGPHVPGWMLPFLQNTGSQWEGAQGNLPDITQLYQNTPELGTAPLNNEQWADISGTQNTGQNLLASGGAFGGQGAAGNQLNSFLSTNGPSAATQAAEQNFQDFALPTLQSQAALSGLGTSGAGLEAYASGAEQASVPFLQTDEANKLSAANSLGSLGNTEFNQLEGGLQAGSGAAALPQQQEQLQLQNLFNQQQQQQQFGQQVQMGPESLFGNIIGGGSSTSVNTPSKF